MWRYLTFAVIIIVLNIWIVLSIYFQSIYLALSLLFATFSGFWAIVGRKYVENASDTKFVLVYLIPIFLSGFFSPILAGFAIRWEIGMETLCVLTMIVLIGVIMGNCYEL